MENHSLHPNTNIGSNQYRVEHQSQLHTQRAIDALVTVTSVAEFLKVHPRTIHRWTKRKWIPHYRVGKSIRYDLFEVMTAAASHAQ